ncbi:MAG: sugar phosphate isomerase/epimerase [Spirochaetaceae bacterium]|nr:sugar phosphate isomerase/epimerase [Spirochaetaceae bacterium]MCF7949560.1 sugar phosphate isomerase/epimerase [Spirochaetia bacterium]MCF7951998.1 sugar phosphate isomerase/epimerase [Spirochaetaceae bacterium]
MNNPVWMMSSALPQWSLEQLMTSATRMGMQGLELCVFRSDGTRSDHVATHLPYEDFTSEQGKRIVETFQSKGLRFSIGAFENLIGGDEAERLKNQNHLLKLIRMAALMGGNRNGITVGTFVGYNHRWDAETGAFEKNLNEYKRVFEPIIRYAEELDVTVVYENCPMEGWREVGYSNTMNNLPATLAARKLMYTLIPSPAHGETYDPSHDIWQFVDPVDVLKHSDMRRIKTVHLKATRMKRDAGSIHWGNVYGKQQVSAELAAAAGVPVPAHEWDRFSYEAMVPGFGGSDSMDWRSFIDYLMQHTYEGVFSIENEGANSKGTENEAAIEQGFEASLSFIKPMIWPLSPEQGYAFSGETSLTVPETKQLPIVSMQDLTA